LLQRRPERILEADARLVAGDDDRAFDHQRLHFRYPQCPNRLTGELSAACDRQSNKMRSIAGRYVGLSIPARLLPTGADVAWYLRCEIFLDDGGRYPNPARSAATTAGCDCPGQERVSSREQS